MALIDVIRFDGLKSREWLFFKYPSEDLVLGTQLIVQEGQVALFVKGGMIADIFWPGTHMLRTENLPLLKNLVNIPFGGKTPFSAEIYFVNTTIKLDVNWGTTDPIQLIDPKYYVKLRIRAFGQMGLKVADASTLFKELIGGMQKSDIIKIEKIKEYYRGLLVLKVKSAIADVIIREKISALEISTQLESLSERVKEQIMPSFEKYGFLVANFYVQSVNFPDEDFDKINKILEDKAAFEIMGEGRYATKRSFDVYEGAATNESGIAGAFVAGGLGMGAAIGMGNSMNANMGNTLTQNQNHTQNEIESKKCIACEKIIPINMKFCPECGTNNMENVCECGNHFEIGMKFCPECGKKV